MRFSMSDIRLEVLGDGQRNCGGALARKRREDVLQRLSSFGTGLSQGQKGEFAWFKQAWDIKGMEDFGQDWVRKFAGQIQAVLDQIQDGEAHAFSAFVYEETKRCFGAPVGLRLPAT